MTPRIYRLTEIHQRIDDRLRHERIRSQPDLTELLRLMRQKVRARDLISRLSASPRYA
jgi:hypothetical protein